MIQAIGLPSATRAPRPPAVDDFTFDARPGLVTVLPGPAVGGKTTALRLTLQLETGRGGRGGRGVALFRRRPLHCIPHPTRELGVLLGDVPGRPSRTACGHLRMLSAAIGVPPDRPEGTLDFVGMSSLADQRLGDLSRGLDRRLGMTVTLLGGSHTLRLDGPTEGLAPRGAASRHGVLHDYAHQGGAVLATIRDPKEATRIVDRAVTLKDGRLLTAQDVTDCARTRLRLRVVVRSPQADRCASLLLDESQLARRAAEPTTGRAIQAIREGGSRIAVYRSSCVAMGGGDIPPPRPGAPPHRRNRRADRHRRRQGQPQRRGHRRHHQHDHRTPSPVPPATTQVGRTHRTQPTRRTTRHSPAARRRSGTAVALRDPSHGEVSDRASWGGVVTSVLVSLTLAPLSARHGAAPMTHTATG